MTLGMDGAVVEWVLGIGDAEETGALLIGSRTESGHLLQLGATGEGSVFFSVIHYVLSQRGTEAADIHEQVL